MKLQFQTTRRFSLPVGHLNNSKNNNKAKTTEWKMEGKWKAAFVISFSRKNFKEKPWKTCTFFGCLSSKDWTCRAEQEGLVEDRGEKAGKGRG